MEPLDHGLFALFGAAIETGLQYVRQRREENGYIAEHRDWPELKWHDNGLPWMTEQYRGPIDYADALTPPIFPLESASFRPQFEQEGSFVSLVEYARAHPQISEHLGASYEGLLESLVRRLVGDVLDRYVHTTRSFDFDEKHLLPIYLPVETYLLQDVLRIAILVPILCLRFEAERIEIDENTDLLALSDAIHLARTPDWHYGFGYDPRVQTTATHAFALTNYTVKNENQVRMWHVLGSPESYPLKRIDNFFAALRIITGHPTGYAQLLVLPLGWASDYKGDLVPLQKTSVRRYPPWFEQGYWNEKVPMVSTIEMEQTAALVRKIGDVKEKQVSIALRRLNQSWFFAVSSG